MAIDQAVKDYIAEVPDNRIDKVDALHQLILRQFPNADVDMSYKMPTYRVGDGWVAIANQKSYVSLYTCGYHHIADFKAKYPQIKTGKGCINFRDQDDLPLDDLEDVVNHAIMHPKDVE